MLFQTVEILVRQPKIPRGLRRTCARSPVSSLASLLALLFVACLFAHTAHAQGNQPTFRRGIGISHIMAWAPLEESRRHQRTLLFRHSRIRTPRLPVS